MATPTPSTWAAPGLFDFYSGRPVTSAEWTAALGARHYRWSRTGCRAPMRVYLLPWRTLSTTNTDVGIALPQQGLHTLGHALRLRRICTASEYYVEVRIFGERVAGEVDLVRGSTGTVLATDSFNIVSPGWASMDLRVDPEDAAHIGSDSDEPLDCMIVRVGARSTDGVNEARIFQVHAHEQVNFAFP